MKFSHQILKILYIIFFLALFSSFLFYQALSVDTVLSTTNKAENNTSTQVSLHLSTQKLHNPISIHGNNDFVLQALANGWQGNGTTTSPYIIANYSINVSINSLVSGINISNTNMHFRLENVTVIGSINVTVENNSIKLQNLIDLQNVSNGLMANNTLINGDNGFYLTNTNNSSFINNHIYVLNNDYGGCYYNGFDVEQSKFNIFQTNDISCIKDNPNTFSACGNRPITNYELIYADNNLFINNRIKSNYFMTGFGLSHSGFNAFFNNILNSSAVFISYSHNNLFVNNTQTNTQINSNTIYTGYTLAYDNTFNVFINNKVANTHIGFSISGSTNLFFNNTVSHAYIGFWLFYADNNYLANNKLVNDNVGIELNSSNLNIFNNTNYVNIKIIKIVDSESSSNSFINDKSIQ